MKKQEQWVSLVGVVVLALLLPAVLRLTNNVVRFLVGAEGRLAAVAVETNRVLGPLPAPWRALAQGGDGLKTLLDTTASAIATLRPEYIRIDHIYDEFGVVKRDGPRLKYDWGELDRVVEKIRSVGAVPFFSLSYMPQAVAVGDVVSTPKDWNEWSEVVQRTIEHYSGEMGLDNVYYEVWNEPDLFGEWKIAGKKDYKLLYLYAARGANKARVSLPSGKQVKEFKLGGPAITGLYKNWVDGFLPYVLENNIRIDFFSWHRYDLGLDKYMEDVKSVDSWLDRHPYFAQVEKVVTEMGPVSESGKENDTRVGAAHLVAVMRELMFRVKYGFSFAIDGAWGIVGKPRYEAAKMLAQLGDQRLSVTGEGTWVRAIGAKKGNVYQVILANYDPRETHSEVVPVTFINLTGGEFELRRTFLGGQTIAEKVATTEAILQKEVPLTSNSVVLVELEPVTKPQ